MPSDSALEVLDRAGYRLTGQRRAVAELIAERNGHFTADDLIAASRSRHLGIGRATIFRSLDLLTDLGVVERLDLPSGAHAFVACDRMHHHHVVCASCGTATEVGDPGLSQVIDQIAFTSGYRIDRHRLELFGICAACQAARPEE